MEKNKHIYEAFFRMSKMVDILFVDYEEKMEKEEYDKERAKDDAPSPSSSDYSSSHHSNEEINQILQEENVELRTLI